MSMEDQESILKISINCGSFYFASLSALVNAISSALWAEVPLVEVLSLSYPKHLLWHILPFFYPSPVKLFPPVFHSTSGFSRGISFESGLLEYTCSIACTQSQSKTSSSRSPHTCQLGRKVAGSKAWYTFRSTSGYLEEGPDISDESSGHPVVSLCLQNRSHLMGCEHCRPLAQCQLSSP